MRSLAALLAIVVLAGCLSPDQPAETASVDGPEDIRPAGSSSASSATGSSPAAASSNASADAAAANTTRAFPFSFQGSTSTSACVPSGPSSCRGLPVSTGGENTFTQLEYEGVPKDVDVTLTWSATTPATSEMYAYVFAMRPCGDGCMEWDSEMFSTMVSGVSPLTLSATDIQLGPDEILALHIGTVDPTPPTPLVMGYSIQQAFDLEGVVTAIAAPAS